MSIVIYIDADACPVKDETVPPAWLVRLHCINGGTVRIGPTRANRDCF